MQWQHSMAQRPAACMQPNGGYFEHVLQQLWNLNNVVNV
jgi:hypothetical protein